MPTYEYRCPEGHDFEHFVMKISDAGSEFPCPTCGAMAERLISASGGLVFKGSGFYITDYGKDGKKGMKPAASKTESGGSESGSGSGSDSGSGSASAPSADSSTKAAPGPSSAPKSGPTK